MLCYDENDNPVEEPDFEKGFIRVEKILHEGVEPDEFGNYSEEDCDQVRRYVTYTEEQLACNAKRFEGQEEFDEKMRYFANAQAISQDQDAAICELYEQNLAMQAESDRAITDLYEMLLEVNNG